MENDHQDKKDAIGRWSDLRYALHLLRGNPIVLSGVIISAVSILLALFAGFIVNPNYWQQGQNTDLSLCWNNPVFNWGLPNVKDCAGTVFPLGTDFYGRSLLQMIILAIPTDLLIALEVVASAVVIGVVLGGTAAYLGGVIDELILRVTDVFLAVPGILLAIVLLAVLTHSFEILTLAITITWWPYYVRLMRSQVLGEKERPYIERLRATGAGGFRILFRHIVPNSVYPIFVQATLDIGAVILTVSALTFLGLGPDPHLPELGNLAQQGYQHIRTAPWLMMFPGITILVISLGFNLLGDGIRDIFDPRLRR